MILFKIFFFSTVFLSWYNRSGNDNVDGVKINKIKCLFHYFERITSRENSELGIITFSRFSINNLDFKSFENSVKEILRPTINENGTIEDSKNALQVDFANMYIGGGVLGSGCVQEEIRFTICPELIVSMLFMERMDDEECILIRGAERFSNYKGYAWSFEWSGDHKDETDRFFIFLNFKI